MSANSGPTAAAAVVVLSGVATRLRSLWAGLPPGSRRGAVWGTGFLLLWICSSFVYALVGAVAVGGALWILRRPWPVWQRYGAVFAGVNAVLLLLTWAMGPGAASVHATFPGPVAELAGGSRPTPGDVALATSIEPGDPAAWMVAATTADLSNAQAAGTVDLQRALLLQPGDEMAALGLAAAYASFGGPLINAQIAIYYSRLAHAPAPPMPDAGR